MLNDLVLSSQEPVLQTLSKSSVLALKKYIKVSLIRGKGMVSCMIGIS